jgi:hypothetical protein
MASMSNRYDHLNGKVVGFIVRRLNGKYKPMVGRVIESEGDDDSFISVVGTQSSFLVLGQAQACFEGNGADNIDKIYLRPVSSNGSGLTWVSELEDANQ